MGGTRVGRIAHVWHHNCLVPVSKENLFFCAVVPELILTKVSLSTCSAGCLYYVGHPVTYLLLAALGSLPPPNLLTSVPLMAGHQASSSHHTHPPPLPLSGTTQLGGRPQGSGMIFSPASEPFPQKLVDKIKSGQFVEMRELWRTTSRCSSSWKTSRASPSLRWVPHDPVYVRYHRYLPGVTAFLGTWRYSHQTPRPESSLHMPA